MAASAGAAVAQISNTMANRFGFPSTLLHGRWRSLLTEHRRLVRTIAVGFAVLAVSLLVGGVWFVSSLRSGLPGKDAIGRMGDMSEATLVYDASDKLAFTIYAEQRIDVPLAQISPDLIRAILAIEDQRFYKHHGFDLIRIASAAAINVRRGRAAQGGSTITQQLARQSFLTPDKTIRRKLQELILAERIEFAYEKPQILELYLNKVYFGDGLYGVEAAARGYFGKHASEVSLSEAALLAGLVKSPSAYAPTTNLQRATARRNVVLQAMLDSGAIDRHAWEKARTSHVVLHDGLRTGDLHGQYFKEQVRQDLVDRFGWERVYQGGLRVFSTIDMATQENAETALAQQLKTLDEKRQTLASARRADAAAKDAGPLQAALIAMDPRTGEVRAMVGGRDFEQSHFNRAVQARRQPGSAFKPFVYAAALQAGYSPATVLDHLNDPIATPQGAWTPEDEHSAADSMNLRTALRTSSNRAAVRLLQQVGIPQTVQYAKDMGVGDVPSVPSLALGSGEVTLQSMTAAYAAFANHGLVPTPILIRRIESTEGQVLYTSETTTVRAISDTTAFLMSTMLADVINAGTGAGARRVGFTLPAAGKTGTTNDFNDAWFVGYTPKLVAGVWVGFDQPRTIMPNGFAAEVAVPLWARFMKAATQGDKPQWLDMPPGITTASVCRLSGKLATDGCNHLDVNVDAGGTVDRRPPVYTEYFAKGTEPTTYCDLHNSHGLIGVLASIFHGGEPPPPPPPPAVDPQRPAAMAAVDGHSPTPTPNAEELPKKKRGFWSKLFGRGKEEDH
jgi:1A family penicillin-binding protein